MRKARGSCGRGIGARYLLAACVLYGGLVSPPALAQWGQPVLQERPEMPTDYCGKLTAVYYPELDELFGFQHRGQMILAVGDGSDELAMLLVDAGAMLGEVEAAGESLFASSSKMSNGDKAVAYLLDRADAEAAFTIFERREDEAFAAALGGQVEITVVAGLFYGDGVDSAMLVGLLFRPTADSVASVFTPIERYEDSVDGERAAIAAIDEYFGVEPSYQLEGLVTPVVSPTELPETLAGSPGVNRLGRRCDIEESICRRQAEADYSLARLECIRKCRMWYLGCVAAQGLTISAGEAAVGGPVGGLVAGLLAGGWCWHEALSYKLSCIQAAMKKYRADLGECWLAREECCAVSGVHCRAPSA